MDTDVDLENATQQFPDSAIASVQTATQSIPDFSPTGTQSSMSPDSGR
jgi:hypothetical protein